MSTPNPFAAPEPWDLVAEGYAAEGTAITRPVARAAAALVRPGRSAHVVDVAAGPGPLALELAPEVASVTAVDFAEAMNAQLRAAAQARSLGNIRVVHGDGQALPLPDAVFDAGFSLFGWMFFPDRARGLAELARVLRPGAPLVVSSWAPLSRSPLMAAMFGALHAADHSFHVPVYNPQSLENPEQLERELLAAGFQSTAVHAHTVTLEFESVEALWTRMVRSSAPLVSMRRRLGEDVWAARGAIALSHLRRELGERPGRQSTTAWLGYGIRP